MRCVFVSRTVRACRYSHTRQGVDDIPPHVDTLALDYTLISVDKEAAVLEQFTSLRSLSLSASEYIPLHNRPDAVCVCLVCL
jgi:hypothetical protein